MKYLICMLFVSSALAALASEPEFVQIYGPKGYEGYGAVRRENDTTYFTDYREPVREPIRECPTD
jgi:hypothetical protein